ncbi:MAG: hypothetical protein H7A45_10580 [Verrucomicrobiales bacterium]|nr:hypothetical protein [Verrucomicrobiales bacterium]
MRKWILRTSVLFFVAGLIVAVGFLMRSNAPQRVTLAEGTVLVCLGATYGTNHVLPGFSRLGRLLPQPLRSWLGFDRPTQSFRSEQPLLTVWLRDDPVAASNRVSRLGMVALLADEDGVVAGEETWRTLWPARQGGGGTFNLQFRPLPGHSRRITLQLYEHGSGGDRTLLGEMTLPNPGFVEAREWEAEPLPAVRTNGALSCRLEQLVAGVGHRAGFRTTDSGVRLDTAAANTGERPRAAGLFRFTEDGAASTNWLVGTVRLADATGNDLPCGSSSYQCRGDLVVHRFGSILWPGQVWDLTVWAKRKTTAPFTDTELIVLEDIAVPALGETNRLDRAFQAQGLEVRVEHLVHRPPPSPGGYSMEDLTHLRVELSELPEEMFFELAELRDDQGRALRESGWSRTHGKPSVTTFAFEQVPAGAKTVTARLVLQKGRRFDFRVRPEVLERQGTGE